MDNDIFAIKISSEFRIDVTKLCMHELGHYMAAKELGANIKGIKINFVNRTKYHGHCEMRFLRSLQTTESVKKYLEDRICILMAGTLGEHLSLTADLSEPYNKECWASCAAQNYECSESSKSDREKSDELMRTLLLMTYDEIIDDEKLLNKNISCLSEKLWNLTIEMFSGKYKTFYETAAKMAEKIEFSAVDVIFPRDEIEDFWIE